jgi:hypothetical protein
MTPDLVAMLLADLVLRGVQVQAHGDRLRFRSYQPMPTPLLERLKLHKAELLAILKQPSEPVAAAQDLIRRARAAGDDDLAQRLTEAWEERIAIITADRIPLAEAEETALAQLHAMLELSR